MIADQTTSIYVISLKNSVFLTRDLNPRELMSRQFFSLLATPTGNKDHWFFWKQTYSEMLRHSTAYFFGSHTLISITWNRSGSSMTPPMIPKCATPVLESNIMLCAMKLLYEERIITRPFWSKRTRGPDFSPPLISSLFVPRLNYKYYCWKIANDITKILWRHLTLYWGCLIFSLFSFFLSNV